MHKKKPSVDMMAKLKEQLSMPEVRMRMSYRPPYPKLRTLSSNDELMSSSRKNPE